ncbi:hypothetical protein V5E97_36270 [Singulisphaera sp. Ch08]|uniref:Right handed beta helix domain-containing protein n=1 Tax=Singulisphaera sp. Ch08 TaxID=3120278 RepID=A0AAU7CF54_9BACT
MTRSFVLAVFVWWNVTGITAAAGAVKFANPGNYRKALQSLAAGDTLQLAAGTYTAGLPITNCHGRVNDWITIEGPASGGVAEIRQTQVANCVELRQCSYVALKRLKIQGEGASGIPGVFGISAQGGLGNPVHHILIEDCIVSDWNTSQQAVGISTKAPAWDWTIRGNKILNCGTGLYLGNSNGGSLCPWRDREQPGAESARVLSGDQVSEAASRRRGDAGYTQQHACPS